MSSNTYVALDTKTLGTAVPTVTFTSIPQGYTDLVLVAQPAISSGNDNMRIRVGNGSVDTGSNYSYTALTGNGSTAVSARASNETSILTDYNGYMQTTLGNNTKIINFQNYSNTTTFKTILTRSNNAPTGTDAMVSLWRSTAAINTMTLSISGGAANFVVGSTFTIYGIAATSAGAKATGGDIYTDSLYYYHVFDANGTFTPAQSISADVLVVAGGGGAGEVNGAAGGAGGIFYATSQSLTATNYTCTVGAGGAGTNSGDGSDGGNSSFGALTVGVGGGGGNGQNDPNAAGRTGGSGGAGGKTNITGTVAGAASTQTGTGGTGYGNAGGSTTGSGTAANGTGGGGGAGAAGGAGNTSGSGAGGVGLATWSSWGAATGMGQNVSGTYYFAGGGGGSYDYRFFTSTAGAGGLGGGSAGAGGNGNSGPLNATANTGGGGGAYGYNGSSSSIPGASGGSGVVIVRYLKA